MALSIKKIRRIVDEIIWNNANDCMVESSEIKAIDRDYNGKNETYYYLYINLKPAFYFNSYQKGKKEFVIRFKDDGKNHIDEEWLSRDIHFALDNAYVKDYYLYYVPSDRFIFKVKAEANARKLALQFFDKEYQFLDENDRIIVSNYANKAKYNNPEEIVEAFKKYFSFYKHLPYAHEELARRRVAATNHGYLDQKHNQVIDGILVTALISFIEDKKRWPRKNEAAYEDLYLPVISGYQRGIYCSRMMEALDYYHLLYRKQGLGDMIFDSMIFRLSSSHNIPITKINQYLQYFDDVEFDVKSCYYKCYRHVASSYDSLHCKVINKEYFIIFKGYEKTADVSNPQFNKAKKRNRLFENYCNYNGIPLVVITPDMLVDAFNIRHAIDVMDRKLINEAKEENALRLKRNNN